VISLKDIFSRVPSYFNCSKNSIDFMMVVPLTTISNLGVANYFPNTNAMLAEAASSRTLFLRALIP